MEIKNEIFFVKPCHYLLKFFHSRPTTLDHVPILSAPSAQQAHMVDDFLANADSLSPSIQILFDPNSCTDHQLYQALDDDDFETEFDNLQNEVMGSFNSGLVNLSEKWDVQVVLIDENTQKMECCYPEKYSDDLRHIFLLKRVSKNHVDVICNISKYYTQGEVRRRFCFYCDKETEISHIPHNCTVPGSCLACRLRLRTTSTYINEQNVGTFCNSAFAPNLNEECHICKLPLLTLKCKKAHKCSSHNSGKKFNCCGKFFKINRNCPERNSLESLSESHSRLGCIQRYCKNCYVCYKPNEITTHHCRVKLQKIPTDSFVNNTIGCFSLMQKNIHPNSGCNECRLNENSIEIKYCTLHENETVQYDEDEEAQFNMGCLLVELEKTVYKVQFADYDLQRIHNVDPETSNYDLKKQPKDYTLPPQKRRDQKKKMKSAVINFLAKNNLNVCERIIAKLLSTFLHLTVFGTQFDLKAVLSALLRNQMKPLIVINEGNIVSMKIEDVKFVDISHFISTPVMMDIYTDYHMYFPEILNMTEFPFDPSLLPKLTFFLNLEDTEEIILKKKLYHSQLKDWNYATHLEMYSTYRTKLLLSGVKMAVNETATFVTNFQKALGGTFPELAKLKLLNNYYNTVQSFLLDIFFLGANHENFPLYNTPKKSVNSNSSHGEYLFSLFEIDRGALVNPLHTYNNPKGQQYYYGMFPDMVSDNIHTGGKIFFQYNG